MNTSKKSLSIRFIIVSAILLFLIVLITVAQGTYGRYITSFDGEISFSFKAKGGADVSCGSWESALGGQTLPIEIATNGVNGKTARVRVYIPEDAGALPTSVVLKWGESEYTAEISAIAADTAAYKAYGAGQICCFYGADGSELIFEAKDNLNATLTLVGDEIDTSGVRLIVDPLNHEGNGGNEQ